MSVPERRAVTLASSTLHDSRSASPAQPRRATVMLSVRDLPQTPNVRP
ncbi:MAG: hypothetical protein WCF24_02775 [Acidimicrobiales bacterium]